MNKYFKNWKTTSAGLLLIIGGVSSIIYDVTHVGFTQEKFMAQAGAILTGIGLVAGADASTPSAN